MDVKKDYYDYEPGSIEARCIEMQRILDFYEPRRLVVTREELEELGLTYDGELYEPKP